MPARELRQPRSTTAAGDLPLVVPGIVLSQELGEARMYGDVRVGADARHLQAYEVLCHRAEAGVEGGESLAVLVERGEHSVHDVFRHVRAYIVGKQDRHAENLADADILD